MNGGEGIDAAHPPLDEKAADGGAGAPQPCPAVDVRFAPVGEGVVEGVEDGTHLACGRDAKIADGETLVADFDLIVARPLAQNWFVGDAFVGFGEVNEGGDAGFEEGVEAERGLVFVEAVSGVFAGDELVGDDPVAVEGR